MNNTTQLRPLGTSDVRVSPVIFGAWAIGGWMWGGNDEQDAIDAIRASLDHGVNAIDTAAIYGQGNSEQIVAKAIKGVPRERVVIATKCGRRWDSDVGSDPWSTTDIHGKPITIRSNSRRDSIFHECEQSLKRLGVDYIDLYQIHWPDRTTPVEEALRAMDDLRKQGKIRAVGVSNYDLEWLRGAVTAAPLHSLQPPFSLLNRQIERDGTLAFCREHNVGVIVYSPMERGLLTGKVTPERQFAPGDHRATHKFFTVENRKRVLAALEQVKPIADRHGASYAQLVINWTMNEPGITAALVGARNAEQAEHNAGAMRFTLTPDERAQVRRAFDGVAAALAGEPIKGPPSNTK
jgi:aryl-alcohol dehydrogenase-like predicted oxidoreductase